MNEKLIKQCELYIGNCETLKKNLKLENVYLIHTCAGLYTEKGISVDVERFEHCKKLLKSSQGIFSTFRGHVEIMTSTILALSDNPEEKLERSITTFGKLKKEYADAYPVAILALILDNLASPDEADAVITRSKALYKLMKKEHPFITSHQDAPFAVLLAFSEKSDEELIADMEECYTLTKMPFDDSDSRQSLSHVLALGTGTAKERSEKLNSLYNKLKENGRKYSRYFELSTLGSLAILPVDEDVLIADILEADAYLKEQKGYGGLFGIDKATRLSHAVSLVSGIYSGSESTVPNTAEITGVMARIAASQAAMVAMIGATTACSAAAASSAST